MPSIRLLKSSALGDGNSREQELGERRETSDEQMEKNRQEEGVPESLLADLAESPFDAHHLDVEAAMALLELASGRKISAENPTMVNSNGGVPLHQNNGDESVNDTDGSRPVWSFSNMSDPNTVVPTPFGDTQSPTVVFSAHPNKSFPPMYGVDLKPAAPAAPAVPEDIQGAATLFSIYLDQTSHPAAPE